MSGKRIIESVIVPRIEKFEDKRCFLYTVWAVDVFVLPVLLTKPQRSLGVINQL